MELIKAAFERVFYLSAYSVPLTLYMIACSIVLCVIYQIFFLMRAKKKHNIRLSAKRFFGVCVFLLYLALVYMVTGTGTLWDIGKYDTVIRAGQIQLIPFDNPGDIMPKALNVLMTIPFGLLSPLIWPEFRSFKKVAATGFFFSLAIELSQLLNLRATDIDDLIANTVGTVIGYLLFKCLHRLFVRSDKRKPKASLLPPILRYEAVIYLICSFAGMFIFFNPALIS